MRLELAVEVERYTIACEARHTGCPAWPGRSTISNELAWNLQRGPPAPCQTFPMSGPQFLGTDATFLGVQL